MAQAVRLAARLQRELKMLQSDPPPGVCAWPCDDVLTHLEAQILGPQGTVYSNGIFKLDIQIPERYPFEPPNIRFVTPVYHPNIDDGGRICLDLLNLPPKGAWRPSLNLSTLLASIGLLLAEPNPDDGLMGEITAEYKHNRPSFDIKARTCTERYATQDQARKNHEAEAQKRQKGALDHQLPESAVENSSNSVSNQKSAHTVNIEAGSEKNTVASNGTTLQSIKPGFSLSKRLTLERGAQNLRNESVSSRERKAETLITKPSDGGDRPTLARAKSSEVIREAERGTIASAKSNLCPEFVSKEKAWYKDEPADFCRKIDVETGKPAAKGKCERIVPSEQGSPSDIEANVGRDARSANVPNAIPAGACKTDSITNSDQGNPTEACKSGSITNSGQGNLASTRKAEDIGKMDTEKENQAPKLFATSNLLSLNTSKGVEKVKFPTLRADHGMGRLKLMKEAVEQVLPKPTFMNTGSNALKDEKHLSSTFRTKSLKLARTTDELQISQSSPALGKNSVDIERRLATPTLIPDDVPTVIVSDSDSDDEFPEEDFRIYLTQRSLNNKRKAGLKMK